MILSGVKTEGHKVVSEPMTFKKISQTIFS
jgi:hypothetical protein